MNKITWKDKPFLEKAIDVMGWIFWGHIYVGIIFFVIWLVGLQKGGFGIYLALPLSGQILWAIILSGSWWLYTLLMIKAKEGAEYVSLIIAVKMAKSRKKLQNKKQQMLSELYGSKPGLRQNTLPKPVNG